MSDRLTKIRDDAVAFVYEWQALEACACHLIQPLKGVHNDSLTLHLEYYPDANDLLSFSDKHISRFIWLIPQVIRAIEHCHKRGWVHGDIKPSNVLYLPDTGSIVLIDFAAALPLGLNREDLQRWEMTPQFATKGNKAGCGVVAQSDDWHALRVWINQLSGLPVSTRQKSKLKRVLTWLDKRVT